MAYNNYKNVTPQFAPLDALSQTFVPFELVQYK